MPASTLTPHPTTTGHSANEPGVAILAAGNTHLAYIHEGTTIIKAQEIHYHPFGMLERSGNPTRAGEFNDDFGLNWGACPVSYGNYGARFYEAQIACWNICLIFCSSKVLRRAVMCVSTR